MMKFMGSLKKLICQFARLEFSTVVFSFSALTLLLTALLTFGSKAQVGGYDVYLLGIVLLAFVSSAVAVGFFSQGKIKTEIRVDIIWASLVFLFGLALGLYRIDFFSIWLDEEVQANLTLGMGGVGIVYDAASSQQMPLSYFFTSIGLKFFGFNELALRLPSCLFIAASGPLFYRLTKHLCSSRLISKAAPLVYLLCPWLIRYAQEGRGYGCMIFFGLLWLNSAHDIILASPERRNLYKNFLILVSCTLLFICSLSLQPAILIASFLPAIGVLFFFPAWRSQSWLFGMAVALSSLIVSPLFHLAHIRSQNYLHHGAHANDIFRSLHAFLNIPSAVTTLFLGQSAFLAVALVCLPIISKLPIRKNDGALWVGVAAAATFLTCFFGLFALLINYPIFVRYYLIFYPVGLLIIFVFSDKLGLYFEEKSDRYLLSIWRIAFLAALVAPQLRALPEVYTSMRFDRWNVDQRSIYTYLRSTGRPGDVGYVIPFQNPDSWEQKGFLGMPYYYRENSPVSIKSAWDFTPSETVVDQISKEPDSKNPRQVFLAFFDLGADQALFTNYCSSRPGTNIHSGSLFLICSFSVRGSLHGDLSDFLAGLLNSINSKDKAYRIFDILLRLNQGSGARTECDSYLTSLKNLNSSTQTIKNIVHYYETRCPLSPNPPKKLVESSSRI